MCIYLINNVISEDLKDQLYIIKFISCKRPSGDKLLDKFVKY